MTEADNAVFRARGHRLRRAGHFVDGFPAFPIGEREDLGMGLVEDPTLAVDEALRQGADDAPGFSECRVRIAPSVGPKMGALVPPLLGEPRGTRCF